VRQSRVNVSEADDDGADEREEQERDEPTADDLARDPEEIERRRTRDPPELLRGVRRQPHEHRHDQDGEPPSAPAEPRPGDPRGIE